jgi:hypothetical protein
MLSYKTTIPSVVLCGSENWFYAIGEERKYGGFENSLLTNKKRKEETELSTFGFHRTEKFNGQLNHYINDTTMKIARHLMNPLNVILTDTLKNMDSR